VPDASFGLEHALLVESIDYRPVEFLRLVTLDLHCVCQDALGQEGLSFQVDVLDLFEAGKTALLADLVQVNDEISSNSLVFAQLFI